MTNRIAKISNPTAHRPKMMVFLRSVLGRIGPCKIQLAMPNTNRNAAMPARYIVISPFMPASSLAFYHRPEGMLGRFDLIDDEYNDDA
jgi:hypothetical protein